jgi:hypothetical protein
VFDDAGHGLDSPLVCQSGGPVTELSGHISCDDRRGLIFGHVEEHLGTDLADLPYAEHCHVPVDFLRQQGNGVRNAALAGIGRGE